MKKRKSKRKSKGDKALGWIVFGVFVFFAVRDFSLRDGNDGGNKPPSQQEMADGDYAEECFLVSQAAVTNPSTFNKSWMDTTVYHVPDSDRVVVQVGFSAKNGAGMKSEFRSKCYYNGTAFESGPEIVQR